MERLDAFVLGVLTALLLCKISQAEWNSTETPANITVSCNHHDNGSSCTDSTHGRRWGGHFSECPKEFRHYCIHGHCRFVKEQNTASCRCESGYFGTRCEYLHMDPIVDRKQDKILIACVVAGLALVILLIVFICICVHKRYNPRKKKRRKNTMTDEVEKLSSLNCTASVPVNTSDTDAV